jgi:hypothetical protein
MLDLLVSSEATAEVEATRSILAAEQTEVHLSAREDRPSM